MSQHYVSTQFNGEDITVLVGWDRPLQSFYLSVYKTGIETDECGDEYSVDQPLCEESMSRDIDVIKNKLVRMKIDMPDQLFHVVKNDMKLNRGNNVSCYTLTGNSSLQVCEVHDD